MWLLSAFIIFLKNQKEDHKRLDNCDTLEKYAGIKIGYMLQKQAT